MNTPGIADRNVVILHEAPEIDYFIRIREACGWGRISPQTARSALAESTFNVSLKIDHGPAGFGRVVSDGCLAFYIQDVAIDERYRGFGFGRKIIEELINLVKANASPGASIGLMSSTGTEAFYRKFGFIQRPNTQYDLGSGLSLFVPEIKP